MPWSDKLKEAGVNIHIAATGGGAGLQQLLWEVPGSSSYLSGGSFPYDQSEQEELLGFMPTQFVSEEAAIDLACAAYMKAFKFGGKKAVGLGITASVASERMHRGDHRVFACIITDDTIKTCQYILEKGVGAQVRQLDGETCDDVGFLLLADTLCLDEVEYTHPDHPYQVKVATDKARERFFLRPFFHANGKRTAKAPQGAENFYALMPGSFNPPHAGHFGLADSFRYYYHKNVMFEIGTNHPNKPTPTVQDLLQRAKMLKGYDVLFSKDMPFYLEKAAMFHGMPFILGADTMLRILDPKWGDPVRTIAEIRAYGNDFYITGREIDGKFVTRNDIVAQLPDDLKKYADCMHHMDGRWDVSSTELRNKK